ncbi:helix-turn-helix transcriptional regulator [Catenovulum sediminis]|uniref:helix-turn-helix transcriptional regulator n=1 Tax=Catenovulum sediminis TaxID=1740262 RepID=UPI00118029BB|nr:helix-turn-helix transcriptional regulator [Catenovulum sediminis]
MNNIKSLRIKLNLTQSQLASACGWSGSQARISNYELGLRTPNMKECRNIVSALNKHGANCELDDVFPPEDEPAKAA